MALLCHAQLSRPRRSDSSTPTPRRERQDPKPRESGNPFRLGLPAKSLGERGCSDLAATKASSPTEDGGIVAGAVTFFAFRSYSRPPSRACGSPHTVHREMNKIAVPHTCPNDRYNPVCQGVGWSFASS